LIDGLLSRCQMGLVMSSRYWINQLLFDWFE
jgi:hypothetical protein